MEIYALLTGGTVYMWPLAVLEAAFVVLVVAQIIDKARAMFGSRRA